MPKGGLYYLYGYHCALPVLAECVGAAGAVFDEADEDFELLPEVWLLVECDSEEELPDVWLLLVDDELLLDELRCVPFWLLLEDEALAAGALLVAFAGIEDSYSC